MTGRAMFLMPLLLVATVAAANTPDPVQEAKRELTDQADDRWAALRVDAQLQRADSRQRCEILHLVSVQRPAVATDLARDWLTSSDPRTQLAAAGIVTEHSYLSERDRTAIRRLVASDETEVSSGAIAVVGRLRDDGAIPVLIDRVGGRDATIAGMARQVLVTFSGRDLGAESTDWRTWREQDDQAAEVVLSSMRQRIERNDPAGLQLAASAVPFLRNHRSAVVAMLEDAATSIDAGMVRVSLQMLSSMGVPVDPARLEQVANADIKPLAGTERMITGSLGGAAVDAARGGSPLGWILSLGALAIIGSMWLSHRKVVSATAKVPPALHPQRVRIVNLER